MPPRTTFSGSSPSPVDGDVFLNEYAQRLKSLFDAAAFPLTGVAGTGNAVTALLDPPLDPGGLVNGMKFTITWAAANTGAVTLAINGGTAVPVVDADNVALSASTLVSGRRSLIEFVGSAFRILSSAGGGAVGAGPAYQAFTTSGTWTRPTGYDPDTVVEVELWGGGGGGGRGGTVNGTGGGGGGYNRRQFRIADLASSVSVTIGAGGAGATVVGVAGGVGGTTSFGSLLSAFGGGGGIGNSSQTFVGGGGGGEFSAGSSATGVGIAFGGSIGGGDGNQSPTAQAIDARTVFGGAGGSPGYFSVGVVRGGNAVFGGGGGGGCATANIGGTNVGTPGGSSVAGGAGGAGANTGTANAGVAPGGGGGGVSNGTAGGAGARGECRIWIFG